MKDERSFRRARANTTAPAIVAHSWRPKCSATSELDASAFHIGRTTKPCPFTIAGSPPLPNERKSGYKAASGGNDPGDVFLTQSPPFRSFVNNALLEPYVLATSR